METLDANSNQYATISSNISSSSSSGGVNSNDNNSVDTVPWYGMRLPFVSPFRSPLSFLLDYSGILRSPHDSEAVIVNNGVPGSELRSQLQTGSFDAATADAGNSAGEVAIRIIGAGEHDQNQHGEVGHDDCDDLMDDRGGMPALDDDDDDDDAGGRGKNAIGKRVPLVCSSSPLAGSGQVDGDAAGNGNSRN